MSDSKYDLFISYAHIDNEPLAKDSEGWVTTFHEALEKRLTQLLGQKPRIWRDPKIKGNDYFDDEIMTALEATAVLISILSPRYIKSKWCLQEVKEFANHAKDTFGGLKVGNKSRLTKVMKTPVARDKHPPFMQRLLGYEFYEKVAATGRFREFNHVFGRDRDEKFWQRLEDVAQDLQALLEMITDESGAMESMAAADDDRPCVYLAKTTFDQRGVRDEIQRELTHRGYEVLPERSLNLELVGPQLEEQIRADLARAILSIHIIGANYDVVPEGWERSIQEMENELAAARSQEAGLPRLIWLPAGLENEVKQPRQKNLIDALHNEPTEQMGADLLETSPVELKTVALERLESLVRQQKARAKQGADAPQDTPKDLTRIYLIHDQHDQELVHPLDDYLYNQGFEVVKPLFKGSPTELTADHDDSLRLCDAALLYHGYGSEAWLRKKVRDLDRAKGVGRSKPWLSTAIYLAPPLDPRKKGYHTREVDMVLKPANGFDPKYVAPFVESLPVSRGTAG
jgi:hypothetical protein